MLLKNTGCESGQFLAKTGDVTHAQKSVLNMQSSEFFTTTVTEQISSP